MKKLLTCAAVALMLAIAAPVAAETPADAPGMWEVTATWPGGVATMRDPNYVMAVSDLSNVMPLHTVYTTDARFVVGMGYNGRLGG